MRRSKLEAKRRSARGGLSEAEIPKGVYPPQEDLWRANPFEIRH